MNSKLLKFSLVFATGAVLYTANTLQASAMEVAVAGIAVPLDKAYHSTTTENTKDLISSLSTYGIAMPGFENIAIANVSDNLNIRKGPGEDKKLVGKLPKNGGCIILEPNKDGWTKIKSGKVTGYVKSQFLITGEEASTRAKKVASFIATSNTNGLNVRKSASVDSEVLEQVAKGEELYVEEEYVATYDKDFPKWVKVSLDSDVVGYVAKEFVDLSYELPKAVSIDELEFGVGVSSLRANLVTTAKKYLGDRYVWGGTTLGVGVDCSGYTQALYKLYGIYIPRVSRDQARGGTSIKAANIKPGDLVFYGNSSSGYINHVAMYIGNGQVIHASNPRTGIKISNMYYRSPVKIVRYIND
ncbi:MAG: hypothetical protein K0S47_1714 [Herbinix sp.]|jgi:uncharacterized protein YgiM (DUF1202 family)|nr:hypothetical protein [Herbinix sp.]